MYIKILGKKWQLNFVKFNLGKDTGGDCDHPDTKGKQIRICDNLPEEDKLRLILHECLHAANYELYSEEYVDKISTDLARILTRLGYKRKDIK